MTEDYGWIKRCIEGSLRQWHVDACGTLIRLFSVKHGDKMSLYADLWEVLKQHCKMHGFEVPVPE